MCKQPEVKIREEKDGSPKSVLLGFFFFLGLFEIGLRLSGRTVLELFR